MEMGKVVGGSDQRGTPPCRGLYGTRSVTQHKKGDVLLAHRSRAHFALCSCVYGRSMRGGGAAQRVRIITRPGLSRCEVTRHDLSKLWIAGTGPGGIIVASSLLQLLY